MKYFLIFLLGLTALTLQAQVHAPYQFSAAIQQAADRDSNAWQLQNYAIEFSKTGNYQASLAEQQISWTKPKRCATRRINRCRIAPGSPPFTLKTLLPSSRARDPLAVSRFQRELLLC